MNAVSELTVQMAAHFAAQVEAALHLAIRQRCGDIALQQAHRFECVSVPGADTYYVDNEPLLRVHRPEITTRDVPGGSFAYDAVQRIEFLATTPADGPRFYVPVDGGTPLPLPDDRVPDGRILVGTKEQMLIMAPHLRPEDFQ